MAPERRLPPAPPGKVTIHEVAARAGVSIKTVSRVLNHEPRVHAETRDRVQQAAAALGYLPNPAARNLSRSVGATLGLAFPARAQAHSMDGQQYVLGIQIGAVAACQRLDFGLLLLPCDWQDPASMPALLQRAQARRVSGLVVASPVDALAGLLPALRAAGLVYSVINGDDLGDAMPGVAIDDEQAARRLTAELIGRGHRRIGHVAGLATIRTFRDRAAGFRAALREAGLDAGRSPVVEAGYSFEHGRAAGEALLADARRRPQAIFAATDAMALGVMHAALARGLRIPQDLSVAGFDDTEGSRVMWPPLATVRQPLPAMAEAAVGQIAGLLYPGRVDLPPQPRLRRFECELVMRESVGAPAQLRSL